jgi:hypothetical protein
MIAEKFLKSNNTETYHNHGPIHDRSDRKRFIPRREYFIYSFRCLLLLCCALVAHKNIGDDTFCTLWHNARRGWDHAALFNEELPLLDNVIRAKSKIEKRIEIDEEILILLGGEGVLLERILSQHGIFDCITPDTSIPASMVADWIAMNAIADSGNERAKDAVNHQKGSHISEETFYAAYRAYFYRNRFSSLNILRPTQTSMIAQSLR